MDVSLLLEYGWVLAVLVVLEGLLAADNALVLAIMVKHLPEDKRKKALFYGLMGAFCFPFRFIVPDLFPRRCMAGASDRCPVSPVYFD